MVDPQDAWLSIIVAIRETIRLIGEIEMLWEKVGENYRGYKGWKDSDAHDYLNW